VALGALFSLLLLSCRSSAPAGAPILPLSAPSSDAALASLQARLASLHQVQALLRVRVTNGEETESFRAQLLVRGEHMELTGYTPIGTTAVSVVADGDQVRYRDVIHGEEWSGTAADLARRIGFFVPELHPAQMALLLLGYPTVATVTATPTGLSRAAVGDVVITYDPPSHPPRNVTVVRGAQRVELAVLEIAAS
jgi:hypothetical protein